MFWGRSWSFEVLGCRAGDFYFSFLGGCSFQALAFSVLKFVVGFEGFGVMSLEFRAMIGLRMCEG